MKGIRLAFAVTGLVFVVISGVLHSPRFHRYLLSNIHEATGWDVSLDESRISLLRGRLSARALSIRKPDGSPLLTADALTLKISPLSAIRGKLILRDIRLESPHLYLPEKKTGPLDPEKLAQASDRFFEIFERSLLLQNTILDQLAVTHLVVHRPDGREWTCQTALLRVEPNLLRQIEIELGLQEALPLLESFRLVATVKKHGFKLKKFDLVSPKIKIAAQGEWKGSLEKGSLALATQLEAPTVLSDPLKITLASRMEKKVARLEKIEAHLGVARLEGQGNFRLDDLSYKIPFTAREVPLEALFKKIPSSIVGPAEGVGEVDGLAEGKLPALVVTSRARIRDFHHTVLKAREASGTLDLRWPELVFDAAVKPGSDGRIQANVKGGVVFKRLPDKEKLQSTLKTLDLKIASGSLTDMVPSLKVSGTAEGSLHMTGAEGTSVQGNGHIEIKNGHWFLGGVDSLVTDISFRPGGKIGFTKTTIALPGLAPWSWPREVSLETTERAAVFSGEPAEGVSFRGSYGKDSKVFRLDSFQFRKAPSSLNGSLSLLPGERLEGQIKGTVNLGWLTYFPSLFRDGRGLCRIDLGVSGPMRDPSLRGFLQFPDETENEIIPRGFPREFSSLEGRIDVSGQTLSPRLNGLLGDGHFRLEGRLGMSHWRPDLFDLVFSGKELSLSRHNVYRVDFDSHLRITGNAPAPRIEGDINILDGRYLKPFIVSERVIRPETTEREPSYWETALQQVPLQLSVKSSGDLRIQNNIASLILESDLKVKGTMGHPQMEGHFSVLDGKIHYIGKDFVLNEGRLDFRAGEKDPFLRLVAEHEIPPDFTVYIELKGPLSNLDVNLSSSPSLPRHDILSLLASGLTQEELRRGGNRTSLGRNILASEISGVLERPLARSTGLDVFRLEASPSGALSVLSVGKNLTDRMSVEFQSDLAPETAQRTIQANYYLTDNILLKGYRTRNAGSNPKYQFNISFRVRLN